MHVPASDLYCVNGHADVVKYLIGKGAIKGDAVEGNNLDGSALLAW